jgi:transcriptional regulator with XRE-family HTH domain
MTLAEWLKGALTDKGISQNKLAKGCHISPGTITAIKYGHIPSADIVTAIARYFGDDPDTVLEIAGIVELSNAPKEMAPRWKGFYRRVHNLRDTQQEAILSLSEGLLVFFEKNGATDDLDEQQLPRED